MLLLLGCSKIAKLWFPPFYLYFLCDKEIIAFFNISDFWFLVVFICFKRSWPWFNHFWCDVCLCVTNILWQLYLRTNTDNRTKFCCQVNLIASSCLLSFRDNFQQEALLFTYLFSFCYPYISETINSIITKLHL